MPCRARVREAGLCLEHRGRRRVVHQRNLAEPDHTARGLVREPGEAEVPGRRHVHREIDVRGPRRQRELVGSRSVGGSARDRGRVEDAHARAHDRRWSGRLDDRSGHDDGRRGSVGRGRIGAGIRRIACRVTAAHERDQHEPQNTRSAHGAKVALATCMEQRALCCRVLSGCLPTSADRPNATTAIETRPEPGLAGARSSPNRATAANAA